ncbi:MAG TPA: flagellar biosynthetic protein FliQ [Roseomonas sp.]|jgi:flagellar biosynthetic protein FliQ
MTETDTLALAGQQALWICLMLGGPLLVLLLVVGLAIAVVQALTQIQEASLAFVPKMAVLGLALMFGGSMAMGLLRSFTEGLFEQVVSIGGLR